MGRGDDHDRDVGVGQDRFRAGDGPLEAVPLRRPRRRQAPCRRHGDQAAQARGTEGGQQRPGGERARADQADARDRRLPARGVAGRTVTARSGSAVPG